MLSLKTLIAEIKCERDHVAMPQANEKSQSGEVFPGDA
jgi:hypothetical protein